MKNQKKTGTQIGGILFVGFMFIGGGVGLLLGNLPVGGALGMGSGFIAMALVYHSYNRRDTKE
jgi:hypothetical protein